jgi:hypothetical protein
VRAAGSHSKTRPPWYAAPADDGTSNSSHDSHVPHGVTPPEQLLRVPESNRNASTTLPPASNLMADTPPSVARTAPWASVNPGGNATSTGGGFSLFET